MYAGCEKCKGGPIVADELCLTCWGKKHDPGPIPHPLTEGQLNRLCKRDLVQLRDRFNHRYVAVYQEDREVVNALLDELHRVRALAVSFARLAYGRDAKRCIGRIKQRPGRKATDGPAT
jgi:hypothetical protein